MDGPETSGPGGSSGNSTNGLTGTSGKTASKDGLGSKSVPSGSATGNPRNKTALAPGHSLMDWIRLGSSGKDLTGVGGQRRPIDKAELARHATEDDAWIAIRGKVFNVTHYLDFHPGGRDELMRGAGRDATSLFDNAHAWVNYEQLLQKCFVGPLTSAIDEDEERELRKLFAVPSNKTKTNSVLKPNMRRTNTPKSDGCNFVPPKPQLRTFFDTAESTQSPKKSHDCATSDTKSSAAKTSDALETKSNKVDTSEQKNPPLDLQEEEKKKKETTEREDMIVAAKEVAKSIVDFAIEEDLDKEVVFAPPPRFDWIQITSMITLIFYVEPLVNPHVRVVKCEDTERITIVLAHSDTYFKFFLDPLNPLEFPCSIVIWQHIGKVELKFKKQRRFIWENFGTLERLPPAKNDEKFRKYTIAYSSLAGRNTKLLSLVSECPEVTAMPLGSHIRITTEGTDVIKCYTPVTKYFTESGAPERASIVLLVKCYAVGKLSPLLCQDLPVPVTVFAPRSSFDLKILEAHSRFLMVTGGTGIAPMLGLIFYMLERKCFVTHSIRLICYNREEEDILCREKLDQIMREQCRFSVVHVLTRPDENWTGRRGRINHCRLRDILSDQARPTYAMVCGPPPFSGIAKKVLNKAKYTDDVIHIFPG